MEAKEGNKIIAEFVQFDYEKEMKWIDNEIARMPRKIEIPMDIDDLEYNSSWDWIMPVVAKCYKLNGNSGFGFFIAEDFYSENILGVWHSIIKFIQWYKTKTLSNGN